MEWEEEEEREGRERLKKGPWTAGEDAILIAYVEKHGDGNWNAVQRNSGLARCGKSCRLRWANHLRPNLKKGSFTLEEENTILDLHRKLGNKWARMANHLPGRTDNEIKNYWNTRTKRRIRAGLPLYSPPHQQNKEQVPSLSPSFSFPLYQNPSIRRPRTDHLLNLPSATMAAFLQYPTSLSPSSPSNYYRRLLPLSLSPSSSPSNSPQTSLTPSLSPASFPNNHYQPCLRHSLSPASSPGSYGQTLAPSLLSPSPNNYHPTSPNKYHETLLIPLSLSPSSSPNNHLHQTLLPPTLSPISSPCSYHQTYISESSSLNNYNQTLLPPSLSLSSSPPSKYNQTFLPRCLYPSSSSPNNYHQTILPHSLSPSSSSPNNHHETPLSYSVSPYSTQSPSPLPLAEGEEADRLACAVMDNPPSLISSNYYGHPDQNNTIITRLRDHSMTSMHNYPFPIYGTTSATTPSTTVSEYLSSCCPNLLMEELLLQQCQSEAVPSKSKQTDLQNHPLQHLNPLPTTKQFLFQSQAHEEDHLLPYYSVDSDWSLPNILLSIPPTITTTNTTPLPAAATMSSAIATSMKLHSHSQELLQQVSATSQEPTSNILQRWLDEATAGGSSELDHLLSPPPIQIRPTEQR